MEEVFFIKIGFSNIMSANRIKAVLDPHSAPIKRIIHNARAMGLLIDATSGRRTRSVIIADSGHVVLSLHQQKTIAQHLKHEV